MTDVEWPDVRTISSFQTFLPPNSATEQSNVKNIDDFRNENDHDFSGTIMENSSNYRPKLPPKQRKVSSSENILTVMDQNRNEKRTNKIALMPPLVPLRTDGNDPDSSPIKIPAKTVPCNPSPVRSIFGNDYDDEPINRTVDDDPITDSTMTSDDNNLYLDDNDSFEAENENHLLTVDDDSPSRGDCRPRSVNTAPDGTSISTTVGDDYSLNDKQDEKVTEDENREVEVSSDPSLADETCQQEIEFVVDVSLYEDDRRRFGFSVIGGADEGFRPRIDTINPGSPADKADLEVGDEILEVNGKTLENASHTEVISHIHQCIRSRTICLRVKRKVGNKVALDLAQNSNVQDAFVIAVEQQARDRLEKLSALRKIKPVDMTKLSHELNDANSLQHADDISGIIENNSIYVTSVPELSQSSLQQSKNKTNSIHSDNIKEHRNIDIINKDSSEHNTEEEIELKQNLLDESRRGCVDEIESTEVIEAVNENTHFPLVQKDLNDSSAMDDDRPHREMAVDVPESFVGTTKQSPRYPPPRQNGLDPRMRPYSDYSGSSDRSSTQPLRESNRASHTPSSSMDSANSNNLSKPSILPKPRTDSGKTTPTPASESIQDVRINGGPNADCEQDPAQLDRIRKYQDDIKKRKEEENRIAKEEEFLRSSLRGSQKLQALEDHPPPVPPAGVVNTAFQSDDVEAYPKNNLTETTALTSPTSPQELQEALQRIQAQLNSNGYREDLAKVNELLMMPEFQKSVKIHQKIQELWCFATPPSPLCTDAQDLVQEVLNSLQESSSSEAVDLIEVLSKFELEGLMFTHDKVAERLMVSPLSGDEDILDRASQYTDDSVKIVRIDKTNEPLGATVRNEGDAVIIGRIVKGGAAEKSGLLHEGDEILEVNEIEMRGKSVNDVCDILATMIGTLTFIIIPTQEERPQTPARDTVMHVKAHFDYDPDDDLYNPCRELGISFQKGDILHVINQDDANWWQAYREGEEDQTLAGLIPSQNFQQQREAMKQTIVGDDNNKEKSKKGKFLCAKKQQKKKKKKVLYNSNFNDDVDLEEILTYEEVALYYPHTNRKRPIVLIGPPNIGRHELRQKLMEDVERFAAAIPHTSRQKKDGEIDGQDYHFITRSQFESDIVERKFVEHGEFEKNYYGTSLNAIRSVVNCGKICVLNLHPQSLKILKSSDLKPYVVFIAPPSLEKLRQNRSKMGANVKDDELKDIIEKAREMEENYGHYFDMIIINSDINRAYHELLKEINILEREPQWVPAVWLHDEIN